MIRHHLQKAGNLLENLAHQMNFQKILIKERVKQEDQRPVGDRNLNRKTGLLL